MMILAIYWTADEMESSISLDRYRSSKKVVHFMMWTLLRIGFVNFVSHFATGYPNNDLERIRRSQSP